LQSGTAYNYFEVAKLWFERGSYKKAINELKTALKLSPDFYEAKLLLGMCYEATFKYNEAKKIYKELLKKGHNHQIEERLKKIEKL
jgi:tetratricopeptide (TPR) repeat protein